MAADIQNILTQMQANYKPTTNDKKNILVYGDSATGKSMCIGTLPKPILLHCFDASGVPKALEPLIAAGQLYVELFNKEDPAIPTEWKRWGTRFDILRRDGLFTSGAIKTFAVDSLTSLAEYAWNLQYKLSGKGLDDDLRRVYNIQQGHFMTALRQILALPTNVYCTAHLRQDKDETTGRISHSLYVSGKLNLKITMLFEEIYATKVSIKSKGTEYELITRTDGTMKARSSMGSDGKFLQYEAADISALLHKAGVLKGDSTT